MRPTFAAVHVAPRGFAVRALAAAACLGGCFGDVVGTSSAAASGEMHLGDAAVDCERLCKQQLELGCGGIDTQEDCVDRCFDTSSSTFMACGVQASALSSCLIPLGEAAYVCSDEGRPEMAPAVCEEEAEALESCLAASPRQPNADALESCEERGDGVHQCTDFIGSSFVAIPVGEEGCFGPGYTQSDQPCDPSGAFAMCHRDPGGPNENIVYYYPLDPAQDAVVGTRCTEGRGMGVYTEF